MAVEILQQPTTPNVTNTNLMYTLSSPSSSNAQFRYVTDIYESGSGNYITTIKTYPNLYGNGILDVARELDDQLDYDLNWQVTGSIQPVESVKTFDLRFGEEYAPSYSGSITVYTGSTSNYLEVFPGEVYKNEGSYNFNTSSFVESSNILSNNPEATTIGAFGTIGPDTLILLGLEDYYTITLLDIPQASVATIFWVGPSGFVHIETIPANTKFNTIGIGPKNLIEYNPAWEAYFNDPAVTYVSVIGVSPSLISAPNFSYSIKGKANDIQCGDEITKFSFINQYGFWDYYNVYNPLRSDNQVDRSIYERSFVRYEDSIGSYNISNRGNTQYRTEYDKRYIITTDYLTKEMSQWLTELFESPEVFVQQNNDFVPINIINTTIRWNMNTSREKLFQYDIEFKYANQPQPR